MASPNPGRERGVVGDPRRSGFGDSDLVGSDLVGKLERVLRVGFVNNSIRGDPGPVAGT